MVTTRNCTAFLFFATCFVLGPACGGNLGGSDPPVECTADTECNDLQECTTDVCDSGNHCRWLPSDGECSTAGDVCQPYTGCAPAIACGGKGDPACADGLSCTTDECDDGVCRFQPRPGCEEPVDTTAPDTKILTGPADASDTADATFTFTTVEPEDATFECKLDSGAVEECTSPKTYTGLANGEHTFEVKAKDAAGNVDQTPASKTWTITLVPPTTCTITCRGMATDNGQQWYNIELSGPNLPASFYGKANCVPPNGSRIRHGFSGPGSNWPNYDAAGNYLNGGPAPSPDLFDGTEPYSVLVNLQATGINIAVDHCGYLDLNGTDGVGGRCAVVDQSGGVTNCRLSPTGGEVLLH